VSDGAATFPPDRAVAFAPGRANLIGEHTDYNDGLSLPFAVAEGITVTAVRGGGDGLTVHSKTEGWGDFVRGAEGELLAAGVALPTVELTIESNLAVGAGLSSSAALEVALCNALLALTGDPDRFDAVDLAKLCSRIENDWVGAHTGLLDQLASLLGEAGHAVRIDFRTLETRRVPLELGDWRLVTVDSGEQHSLAESGYNERRAECDRARELLGVESLRDATLDQADALPDPLGRRVRHVVEENARVDATVAALEARDLAKVGRLLDASHASLRDLYDASTGAVERTVERLRSGGAAGARMMGGGFGGSVLALLPPGVEPPADGRAVAPSAGARLL
jgi:galactokinase